MDNRKILYFLLVAFYIMAVCTRLYWMKQKTGIYIDETFSVVAANYDNLLIDENFELNQFYTGKEVKKAVLCPNTHSVKDVIKDIINLHGENRDLPHTNLYYSALRLALFGVEPGNIEQIIFRGTVLNLVFFTFSYIFFFLLVKLIFEDDYIALIAVFCAFMSNAAISNATYFRPYQLQETSFIVLAYLTIQFIINIKPKILPSTSKFFLTINVKKLLQVAIVISFVFLTGYYAGMYVLLLGLFMIWYNVKENKLEVVELKKEIIFYSIAVVCALSIAQLIYSHYLFGYVGSRALQTYGTTVKFGFTKNLTLSITSFFELLYNHYFTSYVLGAVVLLIIYTLIAKNKLQITIKHLGLPLISIIFTIVITYIAPYKILRYVMPVFPFLILFPLLFLQSIKHNASKTLLGILLALSFATSIYIAPNIEHIYKYRHLEYKFLEEPNSPVLIINHEPLSWAYLEIVPYLNNNQQYIFTNDSKSIDANVKLLNNCDEFTIVICNTFLEETNTMWYQDIVNSDKFQIVTEYNAGYIADIDNWQYKCFKVKR